MYLALGHHCVGTRGSGGWKGQEKGEDADQRAGQRGMRAWEALALWGWGKPWLEANWASFELLSPWCCWDLVKQAVCCSVLIQDFSPCRLFRSGVPPAAAAQSPCPRGEEARGRGCPPPPAGTAPPLAWDGWGCLPSGWWGPPSLFTCSCVSLSVPGMPVFLAVTTCPLCPPVGGALLWCLSQPLISGSPSGALPASEPHGQAQGPRAAQCLQFPQPEDEQLWTPPPQPWGPHAGPAGQPAQPATG